MTESDAAKLETSRPSMEEILSRGLLPDNLPPIFTSASFANAYVASRDTYLVTKDCVGTPSSYNASKRGGQRRNFSVPHPTFIHDQSVFFARHWDELGPLYARARGSLSLPEISASGARPIKITPHSDLPAKRLQKFSRFRHCLITDVVRCFPSIYSHSIPWAINGRPAAKEDRRPNSTKVFGNRLDFIIRQAQDGQTIGIPIGPDTSRMTSELILSAVDDSFIRRSGTKIPAYLRHVDDYWIAGNTVDECHKHLQNIRAALREYELDINEAKTKIVGTNYVFGDTWPTDFDNEIQESFGFASAFVRRDPIATLGKFIDAAIRASDDGIIKHVIRKIDDYKFWNSNWEILEHFLAQCAIQFTHSFDYVARVMAWRVRTDRSYDRELWLDVIRMVIGEGSVLGRDSEVLWALWLLKEIKGEVTSEISKNVIDNCGPLTLGCLAHLHAEGSTSDKKLAEKLWGRVDDRNLFGGQYWALTLELNHLDIKGPALAGGDDALHLLHDSKLSMIDWTAMPKVFTAGDEAEAHDPDHAIEAFSSDYDRNGAEDNGESNNVDFNNIF